jgi:hypothetical protein
MSTTTTVDDARIDLHNVYQQLADCGYDRDLLLPRFAVQSIAARLRSINAISAILLAGESQYASLGCWMRGGLIEAVGVIAEDTQRILEERNEYAREAEKGSA